MRKNLLLSLLAVFCLGLFGCPYESQVPISKPTIPVDQRLLGSWSSKDEVYNTYTVSRASATEYQILQENITGVQKFRGFLSEVKSTMFMNLYSDSTRSYFIYRVKLDPAASRMTLIPLNRNLPEHFGSMDGLRTYLEKNLSFQSMYNEREKADFQKLEGDGQSAAIN